MAPNREILNSYCREEAFGEQVPPFWISLVRIFLINMHVEDTILPVDRS